MKPEKKDHTVRALAYGAGLSAGPFGLAAVAAADASRVVLPWAWRKTLEALRRRRVAEEARTKRKEAERAIAKLKKAEEERRRNAPKPPPPPTMDELIQQAQEKHASLTALAQLIADPDLLEAEMLRLDKWLTDRIREIQG